LGKSEIPVPNEGRRMAKSAGVGEGGTNAWKGAGVLRSEMQGMYTDSCWGEQEQKGDTQRKQAGRREVEHCPGQISDPRKKDTHGTGKY